MTTFDKRKDAAEAKFAHDEETQFKVMARRDKLVGLWAAEKLGLSGDAAAAYAKTVVMADMEVPGDSDVIAKLAADFAAKKISVSQSDIEHALHEKMIMAESQINAEA